jgi:aldehyde:ferredoxin oxidoreductase
MRGRKCMAKGYMGKILWVNLSGSKITEEALDERIYHDFLGGYGLGARVLFSHQKGGVDPLGPENILGFVTGVLTGTRAPFTGKYTVVAKSPLTETWGDANSGGDFAPYLKFSGYDAVFFTGISDKPVYLFIDDGKAELRDATHLWGKDTNETEEMLKAELGKDVRVACIGSAGEKISLISAVITNKGRAAARSGVGAVMGSKRLKAIAVRGTQKVPIANEEKLMEAREKYMASMRESPYWSFFHDIGTDAMIPDSVTIARTPVKNWAGSPLDIPNVELIGGETLVKVHEVKRYGCWGCPMACGGHMKAGEGEYRYPAGVHKPEYESVGAFGTMCLNTNLESIIMANDICNRLGLDTISAGAVIAFAIECYENGLISKKDTDGIELTWGNHRAIVAMTDKIGRREGFGNILADGVKVAAEKIGKGSEKYAVHVQGQEPPMHDPRTIIRMGLGATYKAAPTPARHTRASGEGEFRHPDLGEPPYDRNSFENRGGEQKRMTCLINAVSSAGLCLFGWAVMNINATHDFVNCVAGWDLNFGDVLRIGERIGNIQQAFNIREGLNPLQFKVHDRIWKTPPPDKGPIAGRYCDIDLLVKDWYTLMDFDLETGKPNKKKLKELGLDDVAATLYPNS